MTQHREPEQWPLELPPEEMRRLVELALKEVMEYVASLPEQAVSATSGGAELARAITEPLPETGADFAPLLDLVVRRLVPESFNTASPGYLAYVPGGGLFHAAVADFLAAAVNRYVGVWAAAPALAQLEATVIRWFCQMLGYPRQALGFLTTGGSLANLTAVVTARCERLPEDFLRGTLYASDQVHHSVIKAAKLAGFPPANVRVIPSDDAFRLPLDALRQRVAEDRRAGAQPFLVVGSAGTTNTGAVDDLPALADLADEEGLWLHLDAAYGAFFALTERGRRALAGIERADSVTLDPHKGLFLPYGTGCLLVRDGAALKRTHTAHADYMPTFQEGEDRVDFCQISPELSRDFRGLRVWLPLKMHGAGAFRASLDEKLDLAAWACRRLTEIEGLEIVAPPQLSILAFRLHPVGVDGGALDELNHRFLDAVNARQRVFLNGTVLRGRFALRLCVLSFRTHRRRMEMAVEDIRRAAAQVLAAG